MRRPRRTLLTLAATAGVAASLLAPTAAHADYYGSETDYAEVILDTPADYGHPYYCISSIGSTACFMPYDEKFFVKDTKADGYAAVAEWLVDTGSGYRWGTCVKHTAGTWAICNKSYSEGQRIDFRGARYNSGNFVDGGSWEHTVT
jgi:hypothetical protein